MQDRKMKGWEMKDRKMRDQFHFVICIEKNAKMCYASLLHLCYIMLENVDYLVTGVVTSIRIQLTHY